MLGGPESPTQKLSYFVDILQNSVVPTLEQIQYFQEKYLSKAPCIPLMFQVHIFQYLLNLA